MLEWTRIMLKAFRELLWCALCLAVAWRAEGEDWKLVGNQHGVEIYRRDVPGSDVVAFKGQGTIEAPLWKVASILLDTRRAPEWAESLKESRVVKRLGPNTYIEYNHLGMPFILRDRDFVSEVLIDVNAEARTFGLVYKPTEEPSVAVTRYVRGVIRSGVFQVRSVEQGRRSTLMAEIQCDPKGAIPTWVANFFQRSWPLTTFERLRKQAAKADLAMPEEFKDVLASTLQF
jgi:START domain